MSLHVKMVQHPVGQGGFFTGNLDAGGTAFRWCYDCGSNQYDALVREITQATSLGRIDLLFLSHLDSDHISGVDLLLGQCEVKEVVLPYLDESTWIAAVAKDIANGRMTGAFRELAQDPAGWFGARGVETITYVDAPDDGEEGPAFDFPTPEGGGEGPVISKWTEASRSDGHETDDQNGYAYQPPVRRHRANERNMSASAAILTSANGILDWVLVPYAHQPSARLKDAFEAALDVEFGKGAATSDIIEAARTSNGREMLRRCYDAIWANHNLVSLSLYCGPMSGEGLMARSSHTYPEWWDRVKSGWILTGDSDLKGKTRLRKFLKRYQQFKDHIGVLMVPHHGSYRNFSEALISDFPNLSIGYAAAGPNPYGHPHSGVQGAFETLGRGSFAKIDEQPGSRLMVEVRQIF